RRFDVFHDLADELVPEQLCELDVAVVEADAAEHVDAAERRHGQDAYGLHVVIGVEIELDWAEVGADTDEGFPEARALGDSKLDRERLVDVVAEEKAVRRRRIREIDSGYFTVVLPLEAAVTEPDVRAGAELRVSSRGEQQPGEKHGQPSHVRVSKWAGTPEPQAALSIDYGAVRLWRIWHAHHRESRLRGGCGRRHGRAERPRRSAKGKLRSRLPRGRHEPLPRLAGRERPCDRAARGQRALHGGCTGACDRRRVLEDRFEARAVPNGLPRRANRHGRRARRRRGKRYADVLRSTLESRGSKDHRDRD